MVKANVLLISLAISSNALPWDQASKSSERVESVHTLTRSDVALIREAIHVQSSVGPSIWPDWTNARAPFLFKTREADFLFHHPDPPNDFLPSYDMSWGDTLWVRDNSDTLEYQAAFPVNGIQTVVISAPSKDYNPCLWVLKAVHELFHVYQGLERVVNPFVGPYADKHEISFPFDYTNPHILASSRVESELLFNLVTKNPLGPGDSSVSPGVFREMLKVQHAIFADTLQLLYKQWMEWKEGVARYTERKVAESVRERSYVPTEDFRSAFPGFTYADVWPREYQDATNPIRFVGQGVRGRAMFYYSGMAKAYVLDKIKPGWRSQYFRKTLDQMLGE